MDRNQCQSLLISYLSTNARAAQANTLTITKNARGTDAASCRQTLGASTISSLITSTPAGTNAGVHNVAPSSGSSLQTTSFAPLLSDSGLGGNTFVAWAKFLGLMLLFVFIGYLLFKTIRYLIIFLYDVMNAQRMVYLRVLQTRGDGKVDREMSKELAKDMKEKISRMSQVYNNIYKLGQASFKENMMASLVHKPKIDLIMSYEGGQLEFIIGIYPEFQDMVEGAISAQFSECSIEVTPRPNFFTKKYSDISVLEPEKEPAYTIKTFKYMPDDPINNLMDATAKISTYDTFHMIMVLKPLTDEHNKRMKYIADALYKRQKHKLSSTARRHYLLFPWKIFQFFIKGPSKEMIADDDKEPGMVRMIKAEEDAYQSMGEEASNHCFTTGIFLVTSSDDETRAHANLDNITGAFSIYEDQYLNALVEPNVKKDIFGRFFLPLWKFALRFSLPSFFYVSNAFSVNSLASIFHFPDGIYNRSPSIRWMDYKALAGPDNLPVMKPEDDNGYIISGQLAETFKGGKLTDVLEGSDHRAVGKKMVKEDILTPIERFTQSQLEGREVIEKDGKKYIKDSKEKEVRGYKINKGGVLLGVNIYRNKYSPVYMQREDRMRHHYLIGKSGTGKSVLLQTLARQDIRNGDGCCVIDPHGDLVEDILEFIPKERAKDVIYFDAGNEDRPMGINLYEIDHIDQADRTVNDATEIFLKMFGPEIFGPRIQEYFKYGSLTLLEDFEDRPTLLDVPRLFTDEVYRDMKTKKVKNPVVKNFREKTYAAMGDREKQEIIPYFTSKFVSFNTNRLIRNIIGQTKSAIRFKEAMDSGKIVLINLSKGKIGEINAQLLGMIVVSQIYNGAMARANTAKELRKDFFLYVDEFQNFVSGTFADILSEARKYRLALVMAHQYIAQLEAGKGLGDTGGGKNDVKAAVFGNCGTIQSFKIGAPDAEFLEKEYAPVLGAQDIIGIANYKTYLKLNINNSTSRVFSMNAIYSQDYKNKKIAAILKEYSSKKYGRKREFVDAEMAVRLGLAGDNASTQVDTSNLPEQSPPSDSPPPDQTTPSPSVSPS